MHAWLVHACVYMHTDLLVGPMCSHVFVARMLLTSTIVILCVGFLIAMPESIHVYTDSRHMLYIYVYT